MENVPPKMKEEFDWFVENHDKLVKEYNGRTVIVCNKQVDADLSSWSEAVE